MADFLFIALRYARKLNRELQKLADAADQIRQQNLVFTPQKPVYPNSTGSWTHWIV